jgi:hypothetical protein
MNRIVIQLAGSVGPNGESFTSISLEEPRVFGSQALAFPCTASDPVFKALNAAQLNDRSVKLAGDWLFQALAMHPQIHQYLRTALQAAVGSRYPVFIEIDTSAGAEALPWEALCSPEGHFLGLDERWALARMVEPQTSASPSFYRLTPPIRIAAVLSCLGISAAGELAALRESIQSAGASLAKVLVIASEEQLILELQSEMDKGTAPEVTRVELMPAELSALQSLISDFGPHVLHLFCHGSLQGSPHVALAFKSDWEAANPTAGLLAEAGDFHGFTRAADDDLPWLIVLNCCEGAGVAAAADSQSLALSLALEGVAPVVVGMREPVVSDTANLLTKALYSKLLADLADRIRTAGQSPQPVDWPYVVVAARDKLARTHDGLVRSQAAACTKEWTLPVVYVRPDQFNLQVGGGLADKTAGRAARLQIEALQQLVANLPPDQAGELKADAEARIAQLSALLGVELAADG